ncbi:MAG: acetate/propionate family kinase [bacterium]
MYKKTLIINPGSSSKKYAFYVGGREVLKAHFEIEFGGLFVTYSINGAEKRTIVSEEQYKKSAEFILDLLIKGGVIVKKEDVDVVGFRTVAPGKYFLKTQKIDEVFLSELLKAEGRAPLHVASLVGELKEVEALLPGVVRYGVSDSAFYSERNNASRYYGIPMSLSEEYEIFRFGYHGISAKSAVRQATEILGKLPPRAIVCHLGSGSSVIAVKDGKGFDTSMGFTPLEGLVMSTRVGDIDAGALVYLMKQKGFSPDELNSFLNKKCGLLGISEKSDDMRDLIKREAEGDEKAKTAIDVFVYKIKKQIGAFIATLGGIDVLVFTATIGERSSIIRERICDGLSGIGIEININKNNDTINKEGLISSKDSSTKVLVVKINEMREIFEDIKDII